MRTLAALFLALLTSLSANASLVDTVENKLFTLHNFKLESGVILPEVTIAYETYGRLAADGWNAVLIEHSFTSSHHAAGLYGTTGAPPGQKAGDVGWWDKVIGPGEAIDTNKLFVVSSNALGSSYGSTDPASIAPKTGKPYGPDFPKITVGDIVRAQKALVDSLGVKHLAAVTGTSYGGFETFEWAARHPNFITGIAPVFTAPYSLTPSDADKKLVADLAKDPNWNGGRYYDRGGVATTLTKYRVEQLESFGIEDLLKEKYANTMIRRAAVLADAKSWSQTFDANALVMLLRAHESFDARPRLKLIKAKVLYILSRTDQKFPPEIAPDVMAAFKAAGIDARYVEVDSDIGHLAATFQTEKWSPELKLRIPTIAGSDSD